jgi:hypothetical protein
MRRVPDRTEAAVDSNQSTVSESVDRILSPGAGRGWSAEIVTIEPHRFVPDLWTAEAWLTNGTYMSMLGHSQDDVRARLEEALKRLSPEVSGRDRVEQDARQDH